MSQVEQLITDNLDVWTSAIKKRGSQGRGSSKKIELYGIKKLRELILELAVRGLLVPQDPNDEPASELLEKVATEKKRLLEDGKIKKQKKLPSISEDEIPFELAYGWEWQKLGHLATQITDGVHHTPKYIEEGVPFISVKDIDGRTVSFDDCKYISKEQHLEINQRCNPEFGDVLICRIGTLGRVTLVDTKQPFSIFVSVGLIKFIQEYYTPEFAHLVFHSPILTRQYEQIKAGGSHTNKLNLGDLPRLMMPVAPLNEQPRIVAKVNELMSLCDQLEQQTEDSLSAHQTLVETLLNALLDAAQSRDDSSSKESAFDQAWQRIAEHFDVLFTTEHSIDQLKQTILQLAVMGKLVPQDPNDEPASVLLEKIAAEKKRLVKEGKIKKQKPLPEIGEDEKPFELPVGWEYERINTISIVGTGATPARDNPTYFTPAEFNWVTSGETSQPCISETKEKISGKAVAETNVTIYPPGTLVIAMYGQGKTRGQITELLIPAGTNQACAAMQLVNEAEYHRAYIKLYFQKAYEDIRSIAEGGAQPNLNVGKVSKTVIPLPPIQEQQRIVERVHALMSLCDSLIVSVRNSQTTQLHLADAMAETAIQS